MLIDAQYPGVLGDNAPTMNLGKFEAKGWEGNMTWSDKIGPVQYHIGGTITYTTNKLIDLGATSVLKSGFVGKQQGYPLNSYFGLRNVGKIQTQEELEKYKYYYLDDNGIGMQDNLRLGDHMFEDVNGDGKLDQNDIVYLGTDDPKISFSFNVGAEWKGFSIFAQFYGVNNVTREVNFPTFRSTAHVAYAEGDYWTPDGSATLPAPRWGTTIDQAASGTRYWYDGSYLRLKNVELSYTFQKSNWLKKMGIKNCRIYLNGDNLYMWTKMPDDRESNTGYSSSDGAYPTMRRFNLGIDITL